MHKKKKNGQDCRSISRQAYRIKRKSAIYRAWREMGSLQRRLSAIVLSVVTAFALCEARLAVLAADQEAARAVQQQTTLTYPLSSARGTIYDCAMRPLTEQQTAWAALVCDGVTDYTRFFKETAGENAAALYRGVDGTTPYPVELKQTAAGQQGVFEYPKRYADNQLAAHIIGYCDSDGVGISGLERAFDEFLSGGEDRISLQCYATAGKQAVSEPTLVRKQGSGNALLLSIDSVTQRICEDVAAQHLTTGVIIVMETNSGCIRGCVSWPTFDPQNVAESILAEDTALVNRAFSSYNVGSVYKPLLAAIALEQGIDSQQSYTCIGQITVDGHTYHCARQVGHGQVDLAQALTVSCNCYFIQLGQKLKIQDITEYSTLCGLGSATHLGGGWFAGKGNYPDGEVLQNAGELAELCFGQGKLTATPLQMTALFNTIANDGLFLSPSLVVGLADSHTKKVTQSLYDPVRIQLFQPDTAQCLRQMLKSVVKEGLGKGADIPETELAGKTGTAQTGRYTLNDSGEQTELYESWFIGFYPADNPRYTVTVLLDSVDSSSESAAPVFGEVCRQLYYLGA